MKARQTIEITPGLLDLGALETCYRSVATVALDLSSREVVDQSAAIVRRAAESDRAVLLKQIAYDEPRTPRSLNSSVPVDLETIALKAISLTRTIAATQRLN